MLGLGLLVLAVMVLFARLALLILDRLSISGWVIPCTIGLAAGGGMGCFVCWSLYGDWIADWNVGDIGQNCRRYLIAAVVSGAITGVIAYFIRGKPSVPVAQDEIVLNSPRS